MVIIYCDHDSFKMDELLQNSLNCEFNVSEKYNAEFLKCFQTILTKIYNLFSPLYSRKLYWILTRIHFVTIPFPLCEPPSICHIVVLAPLAEIATYFMNYRLNISIILNLHQNELL